MSSYFELWRQERFLEILFVKKWKCTEYLSSAWHVVTQAMSFFSRSSAPPSAGGQSRLIHGKGPAARTARSWTVLEQLKWLVTLTPRPRVRDKICTENGSKKMQCKWNPKSPKSVLGLQVFESSAVEPNALVYSPLLLWLPENSFSRRFYCSSCFRFKGWTFSEIGNDERNLVFTITSWCYI